MWIKIQLGEAGNDKEPERRIQNGSWAEWGQREPSSGKKAADSPTEQFV